MKKTKKAFTLIELLIVIAIIGILAGIILVSTSSARGKANRASFMQEAQGAIPGFVSACSDGTMANALTSVSGSSNVTWTAGSSDSCGATGNLTFCEKAVNKTAFDNAAATVGACTIYVGQNGIYSDNACTTPFTLSTNVCS